MEHKKFIVPCAPFGKQRPRHNRKTGATYTPATTKRHEKLIADAYKKTYGSQKFQPDDYVELVVYAYYQIPKSASKKKKELMARGEIRPIVKPDWDNVGKLVADALNGVAYDDDKQIVAATVKKYYSLTPCMSVHLYFCGRKENAYDARQSVDP